MSAVDTPVAAVIGLADRVALVRAQLAPIHSRVALLDSYRRESICRLASAYGNTDSSADVLELAYGMRWAELEESPAAEGADPWECLDG